MYTEVYCICYKKSNFYLTGKRSAYNKDVNEERWKRRVGNKRFTYQQSNENALDEVIKCGRSQAVRSLFKTRSFFELPDELISELLGYLDAKTLITLQLVCI